MQAKLQSVKEERDEAVSQITYITRRYLIEIERLQGAEVVMYGSMASGLAIDSSDVDLAVVNLNLGSDRDH